MANKAYNAFYEIQFERLELMQDQLIESKEIKVAAKDIVKKIGEIKFPSSIETKLDGNTSSQIHSMVQEFRKIEGELNKLVNLGNKIVSQVQPPHSIAETARFVLVLLAQLRSQVLLDTDGVTLDSTNVKLGTLRDQVRYGQSVELLEGSHGIVKEFKRLFEDIDIVRVNNIDLLDKELNTRLLALMWLEKRIVSELTDPANDQSKQKQSLSTPQTMAEGVLSRPKNK